MRILQIVNPAVPIPPKTMGGAERVVHALIIELAAMGHEVTLLGEDNSTPPPGVEFHGIGTYWHQEKTVRAVWTHLARYGSRYDAIHNHGRLLYHVPRMWSGARKVHTFHFGDLQVGQVQKFLRMRPRRTTFTPCGNWIAAKYRRLGGRWHAVHNGIAFDQYRPVIDRAIDAPLVVVGRMDPRKGIREAIQVAKLSERRLLIAGVVGDQPHERAWFEQEVLRHCDGAQIQYIGPVDDRQKQDLLGGAYALLMPIQGSEAFGLVMIEALACGCPIIGYDAYSIPEIIREGVTGFLVRDMRAMADQVAKISGIDRAECRRDFEGRFTSRIMAARYASLYSHWESSNKDQEMDRRGMDR